MKTGALGIGIAIVLALNVAIIASVRYQIPTYSQTYPWAESSSWITSNRQGKTLYAVRRFKIEDPEHYATLAIAAQDSFMVYVNGRRVGGLSSEGIVSEVYDITQFVRFGQNYISISTVSRTSDIPGAIRAEVRIGLSDQRKLVASDTNWRASDVFNPSRLANSEWNRDNFVSAQWPYAVEVPSLQLTHIEPMLFPNEHIRNETNPKWWAETDGLGYITAQRELLVPNPRKVEGWVAVSMNGLVKVWVNGREVVTGSLSERTLSVVSLAPFLRKGNNTFVVHGTSSATSTRLALAGLVKMGGDYIDISLDSETWSSEQRLSPQTPVFDEKVNLTYIDAAEIRSFQLDTLIYVISSAIGMFAVILAYLRMIVWYFGQVSSESHESIVRKFVWPLIIMCVINSFLIALDASISYRISLAVGNTWLIGTTVILLVWAVAFPFLETRSRSRYAT